MTEQIIVTAGKKYIDIDAYASMIAYRELLRSLGQEAFAVSSAQINQSVPPLVRNLKYQLDDIKIENAKYILVDVSNPEFLDDAVKNGEIIEIVDHHTGFEKFWQEQGINNQIEFIGSVCTMIYERIIENQQEKILDSDLCKLLIAGILDNTLNLRASITTQRDIDAYEKLKLLGDVSEAWRQEYFDACDVEIMRDYKSAILNDMKAEEVSPLLPRAIGQMVLLNKSKLNYQMVADVFKDHDKWMMNVIALDDGKSYIYFGGAGVKENLEKLFNQPSENEHLLALDQFLLRKQIIKLAREYQQLT